MALAEDAPALCLGTVGICLLNTLLLQMQGVSCVVDTVIVKQDLQKAISKQAAN